MKQVYLIIIAIILIIVVGIACFKFGFTLGKKSLEPTVAKYKQIIDYHFPTQTEILNISGKITTIQDNTLNIETTIQDPYALPSEWKIKTFKVSINDKTEFTKFDPKEAKNVKISFDDLKVGDRVRVESSENIKDKTEFEATAIRLFTMP